MIRNVRVLFALLLMLKLCASFLHNSSSSGIVACARSTMVLFFFDTSLYIYVSSHKVNSTKLYCILAKLPNEERISSTIPKKA